MAETFAIEAVMGPDTDSYANLSPVNAASGIVIKDRRTASSSLQAAFSRFRSVLNGGCLEYIYVTGCPS